MRLSHRLIKTWTIFCVAAALSGCVTTTRVEGLPACPPSFYVWTPGFQVKLADALKKLPDDEDGQAIRLVVRQTIGMRAEVRAAGCKERPTQ